MEPLKIQVFLDNICDIYRLDESGLPQKVFDGIPLEERTVGSRRSFDAMQAGHTIQKVVRIPNVDMDLNNCFVEIQGDHYQILQVQKIFDTSPRCLQLTLEQPNILWAAEGGGPE